MNKACCIGNGKGNISLICCVCCDSINELGKCLRTNAGYEFAAVCAAAAVNIVFYVTFGEFVVYFKRATAFYLVVQP